jgi:hypothetical protein
MLIGLNELKKIIAGSSTNGIVTSHHNCIICGCQVELEIHETSGGYGLLGGVLYEMGDWLYAKCAACYYSDTRLKRKIESLEPMHL